MKMNSLLRTNRRNRWSATTKTLAGAVFVFFIVFIWTFFFPMSAKRVAVSVGIPLWHAEDATIGFFTSLGGYFVEKEFLYQENLRLKQEIEASDIRVAAHDLVVEENAALKELLGRVDTNDTSFAYVLRTPGFAPFDYLLIDKGLDDGITVGMKALVENSAPIGEVVAVNQKTAEVKLYSSPDYEIEAFFESSRTAVRLKGAGSGTFEITVPKDTEVIVGDRIFLPGSEHHLLAIVESIEANEAETFKKVYAHSPMAVSSIRYVFLK